ncbi:hypothetical protein PanWU01x14_345270 [Parasponia andersonii]|uniref:Uncharacterized protein n=1 Tax=Parasponia andersonii TaxID=3476 RepID=A0A2P5ACQ6_PARAD|nr:hypothetical protein PanWU01x14_345270 [Parasponia andersonii]
MLESHLSGNFVRSIATDFSDSFRRTLDKGKDEIRHIARSLEMDDAIINPSFSFYRVRWQLSAISQEAVEQYKLQLLVFTLHVGLLNHPNHIYLLTSQKLWVRGGCYVFAALSTVKPRGA